MNEIDFIHDRDCIISPSDNTTLIKFFQILDIEINQTETGNKNFEISIARGENGLLGFTFAKRGDLKSDEPYVITNLTDGGSAQCSGLLKEGDQLICIDQTSILHMSPSKIRSLVHGTPGTWVALTIRRESGN